jgi:protein O-GlcNAc transferase
MTVQEIIDQALALHQDGALDDALPLYRQAFDISGEHPTVANLLAVALDEHGRGAMAETVLGKALRDLPENAPEGLDPALNLARLRLRRGAVDDAVEPLRRAVTLESIAAIGGATGTEARGMMFQVALSHTRTDLAQAAALGLMTDDTAIAVCARAVDAAIAAGALMIARAMATVAVRARPLDAIFQAQLGNLLARSGENQSAITCYRRCQIAMPDMSVAANNLANLLGAGADSRAALRLYRRAVIARGPYGDAEANLARLLTRLGAHQVAVGHAYRAIELEPDNANHHDAMGTLAWDMGDPERAAAGFRKAVMLEPGRAAAWSNLGSAIKPSGRSEAALTALARAVTAAPGLVEAHRNIGVQLAAMTDMDGARTAYARALALDPADTGLAFKAAMTFNTIPQSVAEIDAIRDGITQDLEKLRGSGGRIEDPMAEVGLPNFHLAYHGRDDRDIQTTIARTYLELCPGLGWRARHCQAPSPRAPGEPIKIGFFSVFLHEHSIRYIAEGVIQNLDRRTFEVIVIGTQPESEISVYPPESGLNRQFQNRYARVPNSLMPARRMIADAELDILVYCDIGIEPLSYYLGFARLAPVQCVLQGHPVTTGIPNIDYFISSAWQEPEDFHDHYTETCVRLSDVAFYYVQEPIAAPGRRSDYDLPQHKHLYFCPQTLFKFHPDFDIMLRRILERDPDGLLVLLRDRSARRTDQLARRLGAALGPTADRVIWLDRMPRERYYPLLVLADVILDTPYFSGGNTTIQSLALGVPTVTFASPHVRGRISLGWMRILETMELVARNGEDYAAIAVAAARDPVFRGRMRAKLRANAPKLFRRDAVVREHERFFKAALDTALAGQPRLDWGPRDLDS